MAWRPHRPSTRSIARFERGLETRRDLGERARAGARRGGPARRAQQCRAGAARARRRHLEPDPRPRARQLLPDGCRRDPSARARRTARAGSRRRRDRPRGSALRARSATASSAVTRWRCARTRRSAPARAHRARPLAAGLHAGGRWRHQRELQRRARSSRSSRTSAPWPSRSTGCSRRAWRGFAWRRGFLLAVVTSALFLLAYLYAGFYIGVVRAVHALDRVSERMRRGDFSGPPRSKPRTSCARWWNRSIASPRS